MGLSKFWKSISLANNAEKVYVSDIRTDLMGIRMVFNLEEFIRLRRTMKVPEELVYHVALIQVDPEDEGMNGAFAPASHDFTAWEIQLPVSDRLDFSQHDLDRINRNLALLMRHTAQAYTLFHMFENLETMSAAFKNIQGILSEDARVRSGLAKGFRVLIPSSLPPEIELERTDHGEREREGQTHPED